LEFAEPLDEQSFFPERQLPKTLDLSNAEVGKEAEPLFADFGHDLFNLQVDGRLLALQPRFHGHSQALELRGNDFSRSLAPGAVPQERAGELLGFGKKAAAGEARQDGPAFGLPGSARMVVSWHHDGIPSLIDVVPSSILLTWLSHFHTSLSVVLCLHTPVLFLTTLSDVFNPPRAPRVAMFLCLCFHRASPLAESCSAA
jgi:hypothetical protein